MGDTETGDENRGPFVDAVDEAMATARPKKNRGPRSRLEDVMRRRLRDAEKIAKLQRQGIKDGFADPVFTRAFNETTKTITNLGETMRRIHDAERKAFGGLTEEQLDDIFRGQLGRVAMKLSLEERRVLLEMWFGKDVADVLLRARVEQTSAPAEVSA